MFWIKLNQMLHGVFSILVICVLLIGSLMIPLSGQTGRITVIGQATRAPLPAEEFIFTMIFVFVIIIGGEAVRVWVRQAFSIDESKLSGSPNTVYSEIGKVLLVKNLIGTIFFCFLLLIANGVTIYFLVTSIAARKDPLPTMFWIVLGTYAVYVVIRKPIGALLTSAGRGLPGTAQPSARSTIGATAPAPTRSIAGAIESAILASYTIQNDSIVLDLNRKRARPPGKRPFISVGNQPSVVTIRFDELDEIRALTFVEAQAFVQYKVGPDLQLGLKLTSDLFHYMNGETERPSHYGSWGSLGTVLLLRGSTLFYLVSVSNPNVNDLIDAFNAFKNPPERAVPVVKA